MKKNPRVTNWTLNCDGIRMVSMGRGLVRFRKRVSGLPDVDMMIKTECISDDGFIRWDYVRGFFESTLHAVSPGTLYTHVTDPLDGMLGYGIGKIGDAITEGPNIPPLREIIDFPRGAGRTSFWNWWLLEQAKKIDRMREYGRDESDDDGQ